MLMGTLVVNLLCLGGTLVVLWRLWRTHPATDVPQSFARMLARSLPQASPLAACGETASPAGLALEANPAMDRFRGGQGRSAC